MAVRIRLRRVGKRNAPAYRIVVLDQRSPRDGKFIENIGTYNPRAKSESVELDRVDYWVGNGAQPSETVAAIIKRARAGISWSGTQTAHHRKPVQAAENADTIAPAAEEATEAAAGTEEANAETDTATENASEPTQPEAEPAEETPAEAKSE